jgi:hypothetical protein
MTAIISCYLWLTGLKGWILWMDTVIWSHVALLTTARFCRMGKAYRCTCSIDLIQDYWGGGGDTNFTWRWLLCCFATKYLLI